MTTGPDALFSEPRLAALYDVGEGGREDLDVYVHLLVDELGARSVIDIGCGTGTLAIQLAEAGLEVVGIDPAAASLAIARDKAGADAVRWIDGELQPDLDVRVDAAVMTGNVAQVFVDHEAWRSVLAAAAEVIVPGGHLVFETRDPARQAWLEWTPEQTRKRIRSADGEVETWCELLRVEADLVTFRWSYRFDDGSPLMTSESTLRFRSRATIEHDLDAAGFEVVDVRDAPDRPGKEFVFIAHRR